MEHSRPEFIVLDEFAKLLREVAELRLENERLKETIDNINSRPSVIKPSVIKVENNKSHYDVIESSLFSAAPDLLSSLEATCRILQFDLVYSFDGTEWRSKPVCSNEARKVAVDKAVSAIRRAYGIGLERFVPVSSVKSSDKSSDINLSLNKMAPEMFTVLSSVLKRLITLSESRIMEHGSAWHGYAWYSESFDLCISDIRAIISKVRGD